jgi:hypothetical protein
MARGRDVSVDGVDGVEKVGNRGTRCGGRDGYSDGEVTPATNNLLDGVLEVIDLK